MMLNSKKPKIRFKGFNNDWEQRKFNQFAKYRNGKAHENDICDGGKYIVVNSKFCSTDGEVKKYSNKQNEPLYKNDIAFVLSDVPNGRALARTFLVEKDNKYTLNQRIAGITPLDNTDPYYLYIMMNRNGYFLQFDDGAKQTNLSTTDVFKFEEMFPNKKEQEDIGNIFKQIDNLIALYQRKYEKLVNIRKSILEKMLPKNLSKVPEIRFKGFSDDWEQHKLSSIASMHARIGWQNLRTSEFLDNGKYLLITGTDFIDGRIDYSSCHYVEKKRYDQDRNIQVSNGSILITKDGTLGKVALIQGLSKPATLNAGVFNVLPLNKNNTDTNYLFQYLKAPFLLDYVNKKATGGTIKHLNQNILVDFPINTPNVNEQAKLGRIFYELDNLITLHQSKYNKLIELKKSLLEKMFI